MEEIMRLSDSYCVYTLNYDLFKFNIEEFSFATLNIIKQKMNFHKELSQRYFDLEIKKGLIDFYLKQLSDYDFIQRMGQYNGNQNRYYVTIWMKAHVRENFYKIKNDIREITNDVVEELLKKEDTRNLFRPEYLQRRQEMQISEAESRYSDTDETEIIEVDENELIPPEDYYSD